MNQYDIAAIRARLDAYTAAPATEAEAVAQQNEFLRHAPADMLALLNELDRGRERGRRWKASAKKWRRLWENEHHLACTWGNDLGLTNNLLQRLGLWRADVSGTWRRVEAALNAVKGSNQ